MDWNILKYIDFNNLIECAIKSWLLNQNYVLMIESSVLRTQTIIELLNLKKKTIQMINNWNLFVELSSDHAEFSQKYNDTSHKVY